MTFRGEYWYQDGYLELADDDKNHEGIAESAIYANILNDLPVYIESGEYGYNEEDMEHAVKELYDDGELDDVFAEQIRSAKEDYGDDWGSEEFVAEYGWQEPIAKYIIFNSKTLTEETKQHLAFIGEPPEGTSKYPGDSRMFACQFYGWIAVRNNTLDAWDFGEQTRKNMVSAILEVAQTEEGYGFDEEELNEMIFEIALYSSDKRYEMTIDEITNFGKDGVTKLNRGDLNQTDYWRAASKNWALADVHPFYKNRKGVNPLGDSLVYKNNNSIFMLEKLSNYLSLYYESKSVKISIEDILPAKADMEVAVHSLKHERYSNDKSPLKVYKCKNRPGKYVLADGHHRLLQAILNDADFVNCIIDNTELSDNGTVTLDVLADGDFYGLDQTLDEEYGWKLKQLK
jgi:hypothetical protein